MGNVPNYSAWINEAWGWPQDVGSEWFGIAANASNIIVGGNPAYSINQFLAMYPKFFGVPTQITGTTNGTTGLITGVANTTGLEIGDLITGPGIDNGSLITAIATNTSITVAPITTAAGTSALYVYKTMPIPLPVLLSYMYLALYSIWAARWFAMWPTAIALYIAHFATLWIRSEAAVPNTTAAQIAQAGIAVGIQVAKAVQDVSVSYQALVDLEGFGAYALTPYGQQLVTFAKAIGSGPMMLW